MTLTASKLRENIYRLLDQVLKTGQALEIERKGKRLKIIPLETTGKLKNLQERPIMTGDAGSLVHLDWSSEWKGL